MVDVAEILLAALQRHRRVDAIVTLAQKVFVLGGLHFLWARHGRAAGLCRLAPDTCTTTSGVPQWQYKHTTRTKPLDFINAASQKLALKNKEAITVVWLGRAAFAARSPSRGCRNLQQTRAMTDNAWLGYLRHSSSSFEKNKPCILRWVLRRCQVLSGLSLLCGMCILPKSQGLRL